MKNQVRNKISTYGLPQLDNNVFDEIETEKLKENPVDIVCMGIGENGHIAFNDPGVADFNDPALIKTADLDEICRQQQVNDGCFATLNDVPKQAMSLTMSFIMSVPHAVCVVPTIRKANAVYNALNGPVTTACPASILRNHSDAKAVTYGINNPYANFKAVSNESFKRALISLRIFRRSTTTSIVCFLFFSKAISSLALSSPLPPHGLRKTHRRDLP